MNEATKERSDEATKGQRRIWLWRVIDGETHWIAAESRDEAIAIVARDIFDDTVERYKAETEPLVELEDMTKPLEVNVTDECCGRELERIRKSFSKNTAVRVTAIIPPAEFRYLRKGLVATTVD